MLTTKDLKDLFGESSPDRVILRAQKLAAKGRNDQAIAVIKEAVDRLGEVADLRIEMATLYLSSSKPREAADCLRALLKADPSQVKRVEEFVGWARTQFADITPLYEPMAEGFVARRSFAPAMECLERIERKALETMLEGRLANLNRFLEKGTLVPKSALPTLYLAALSYEVLDDWQKALDSYRKVLTASPSDFGIVDERLKGLVARHYKLTTLRLAYADLLESLGHGERAQQEYLTALEVDPRCAPQVGRYLDTVIQASPGNDELLWAQVKVHLAEGKLDDAVAACALLVDHRSHLAEIEKMLEELSAAHKETVDTQLLLGKVSLALGKVQRAVAAIVAALGDDAGPKGIAALEEVIAAHPSEARPYQILADCHLKQGQIDKCLATYRALRHVDPSAGTAIATRLTGVLAADPTNKAARDLLEEVCVESGDAKGALPFLRRRLRLGTEQAREVLERLRPMLMAAPDDQGLKLAAAEACAAAGEEAVAWGHVQDLIAGGGAADATMLHLLVLCAGSSSDLFRKAAAHLSTKASRWSERPEVIFAMAEAAGRAGEVKEAVERYRKASSAAPETALLGAAAIRALAKDAAARSGEDRALLAEALLDDGDLGLATECLRGAGALPPATAGRLVERFGAALRADPRNIALSTGLAQVCAASGQHARALEIARAGLTGREDAASAPLTMTYGDALALSGRPSDAARAYAAAAKRDPALGHEIIERLQRVIQIDGGLETAHLALGRLLINEGRVVDGVGSLATAWSIKPDLGPAVLKDLERTARKHPGEIAVDHARAQILLESGDPVRAAEILGATIGGAPDRLDEILTRLEAIVVRHPSCGRAHVELGRAYLARRWAARACASFLKAHQLDASLTSLIAGPLAQIQNDFPDEPEVHLARGSIYEAEGKLVPAAEAYQKAAGLGGARAAAGLEGLRRLCASGREVPGAVHLMRGRACRILGEVNEAVQAARQTLKHSIDRAADVRSELDLLVADHPASAVARLGRAAACVKLQDLAAAATDLVEALRLDPACSDSVVALATEILDRRPSFAPAARALSDARLQSGDVTGAARALDLALDTPESGSDLDLLLARRELALRSNDARTAAALLARAEKVAVDRDAFLTQLHREALRNPDGRVAGLDRDVAAAIQRTDYGAAAEILSSRPTSLLKAWVMERAGRYVEAGLCLNDLIQDGRAAARYTSLLDRLVARELEGKAVSLMGETILEFVGMKSFEEIPSRPLRAGRAAQGGAR